MNEQQPKEYIITEDQLHRWEDDCLTIFGEFQTLSNHSPTEISEKVIRAIRSRPHPAPLAKENLTVGMVMAYEAGLAEGARKAREKVLDELCTEIRKGIPSTVCENGLDEHWRIGNIIASLRHHSEQQEQPR